MKLALARLITTSTSIYIMFVAAAAHSIEPADISLGIFKVTPKVAISNVSDSNIYLSNKSIDKEISSNISSAHPSLHIQTKDQTREIYSDLYLNAARYSDTPQGNDDYTDFGFSIGAKLGQGNRQSLFLNAKSDHLHDNRGTAFTTGQSSAFEEPDKYTQNNLELNFQLGQKKSKMLLNLGLSNLSKEYTNNETTNSARNYDANTFDGNFRYKTFSKLSMITQVIVKEIDYDQNLPAIGPSPQTFDGDELSAFLGIAWKATAKTSGEFKYGQLRKTFDDPNLQDIDNTNTWELNSKFEPSTRALFTITSISTIAENEGTGTAKETKLSEISWSQKLPQKIISNIKYSLTEDIHSNSNRDDDTAAVAFNLAYNLKRWISFSIGHSKIERESSISQFDYDKRISQIGMIISL